MIRHHGLRLLAVGASALAVRPALLLRFLTTRVGRYGRGLFRAARPPQGVPGPAAGGTEETVAVLTHVAVDSLVQGEGGGSALVDAFVNEVRRRGSADRIELVTLADGGASPFYERLGWTACGEHLREGARYRRFSLSLR